jgi:hypothetical protein
MNLCHVVKYTIYEHVKLEFQCYFKCIYLDLAVVNIVEGGIDMVDTTVSNFLISRFAVPWFLLILLLCCLLFHLNGSYLT